MTPNITLCPKICTECGFTKYGTTDTIYADAIDIIDRGILFPCHMYLRAHTGDESHGTETLDEVKVCRGYVAYQFVNGTIPTYLVQTWNNLWAQLKSDDLDDLYTPEELIANHRGLREGIYLNNPLGS